MAGIGGLLKGDGEFAAVAQPNSKETTMYSTLRATALFLTGARTLKAAGWQLGFSCPRANADALVQESRGPYMLPCKVRPERSLVPVPRAGRAVAASRAGGAAPGLLPGAGRRGGGAR